MNHLADLKDIKVLDVSRTKTSPAGIARLKAKFPGLKMMPPIAVPRPIPAQAPRP